MLEELTGNSGDCIHFLHSFKLHKTNLLNNILSFRQTGNPSNIRALLQTENYPRHQKATTAFRVTDVWPKTQYCWDQKYPCCAEAVFELGLSTSFHFMQPFYSPSESVVHKVISGSPLSKCQCDLCNFLLAAVPWKLKLGLDMDFPSDSCPSLTSLYSRVAGRLPASSSLGLQQF